MAFTYDLDSSDADELLISRVRLELGDTVENSGVKPNASNISDEEISLILDANDNNVTATVADLADILARHWANMVDVTTGPRKEALSQASKRWRDIADEMRASGEAGSGKAFSFTPDRADGFSAYADASEYTSI